MALSHLVILIPGIGGSNLFSPDGNVLWGHDLLATVATTFRPEALDISKPVVPTGVLQVQATLPWMPVASYSRLRKRVRQRLCLTDGDFAVGTPAGGASPSASVVEFPYDFRQSMDVSAGRLKALVDDIRGERRVVVVAHSMGGLVARWWWGVLGGYRVCDGLITVGTPHRGAPKALDWLLNGVSLGSGLAGETSRVLLRDAHEILCDWPAIYDLLPRYPAVLDGDRELYPHDLRCTPAEFQHRAREAYDRHARLENACQDASFESPTSLMAFYSTGHATPSAATIQRGRVEIAKRDPAWIDTRGWEGGDGTVPAFSAIPIERDARVNERAWVPDHHLGMAASKRVVQHLAQFGQAGLGSVRGPIERDQPSIGLDYDEVIAAGAPGSIEFRLNGAESTGRVKATACVRRDGGTGELKVEPTGDGVWRAHLPGLSAGAYEFVVALDHVEGVDRLESGSVVGVIEP